MKRILFLLCLLSVLRTPAEELGLTPLRDRFELRLEEVGLERELAWTPVARAYRDALDRLFDTVRMEGDLDELTDVRREQQRVEEHITVPENFSDFPRLRGLQERLRDEAHRAARNEAEQVLAAARDLDQRLDALQRQLVNDGEIDEALAVREARQTLPEHEAVAAALARLRVQPAGSAERSVPVLRPAVPPEAKPFMGRRFMLVRENLRWEDARARAEEMGGRLVVIDSARLNEFLQKEIIVSEAPRWVWIGAYRENGEAPWQWVNGEPLRYTNWKPDNPSGRDREDYLSMVHNGTWNNLRNREIWFIVEWGP